LNTYNIEKEAAGSNKEGSTEGSKAARNAENLAYSSIFQSHIWKYDARKPLKEGF